MIICLSGENSFGLQRELDMLVSGFVAAHGDLALERIDGEEVDINRLSEALHSLPFLAAKKMVILSRVSANKQFVEQAEPLLTTVPDTTEVIIVEPKLDKRLGYYKYLKKMTDFREFKSLDVPALAQWLTAEAKQRDGSLSSRDAQYLVERVGTDQQLLGNELEKLLLYDATISRQTIDLLTEATPQSTIFQLLEAAFAGNAKRAMSLYQEQRAMAVETPQIIAMLAWQLHILALIKTASKRTIDDIAAEARLSPFVVRKSQSIASKLTLAALKQLIAELLSIDIRSKRQTLDVDEALQNYLLNLTLQA